MKAWFVRDKYEFTATVVFAETRGKARNLARYTDACEGADFCDIEVHRLSRMDKYYRKGKIEMEWEYPADRLALVKDCGFRCECVDFDNCEGCSARDYCGAYKDVIKAYEDTEEDK